MNDLYVECLVQRKASVGLILLKYICFMLCIALLILNFMTGKFLLFAAAMVCAVAGYYFMTEADVEFEYLYVDREITVDKVISKSRRKEKANFQVDKIQILAPMESVYLQEYTNKSLKVFDYSDGEKEHADTTYVMIYEGNTKVILSPDKAFLEALKNVAPRKVFLH